MNIYNGLRFTSSNRSSVRSVQTIRQLTNKKSSISSISNSKSEEENGRNYEKILQNSSVYAVTQVGQPNTLWSKILWMIVLTAALIGCCYKIYMFMDLYFHYPVIMNLNVEQRTKVEFPAVIVCNLNRMKSEYEPCLQNENNLPKCAPRKPPRMFFKAGSGPLVLTERRNFLSCKSYFNGKKYNSTNDEAIFLEKYSQLPVGNRIRFGYQENELIINCSFNGRLCKPFPFSMLTNNRYGNCFTFNKFNMFLEKSLVTSATGSRSGLELVLSTNPNHSVPISHNVGFRIIIHHPLDAPNPEKNGINVVPGYETHVSLKTTLITRLPTPYKDECVNYGAKERPFEESQTICMKICIQKYNHEKCGCIELQFREMIFWKLCDMTNSTEVCCLDKVMNDLAILGTDCNCPLPCQSTYFHERIAIASWPSRIHYLKKYITENENFDIYRASHAKVRIFFSTMERTVYGQQPKFLQSEIFSHLGGELGLWLGLSLVALFELTEIIIHFVCLVLINFKNII
ncbi:FMRFamide-activated amiloride-sensitive sodium channel [Araneus ventricosus]|uniref:FMRFamide-activated amiloride-sensitive sodium channel n=1 Tax=Araneus ventricosus TaxID=182803 RepID=A0A4Y2AQW3_ARAVE|nr:FMRFamide-activated amiloride-sensitive sodium channel [Araneus ventricosus]